MLLEQGISRRTFIGGGCALIGSAVLSPSHAFQSTARPGIAVTIDDFGLRDSALMDAKAQDAAIRKALSTFSIQAGAFPTGKNAVKEDVAHALGIWSAEGHIIGNHSFSHSYFDGANPEMMMDDVMQAEAVLATYPTYRKWLRFPYLAEGKTTDGRDMMRDLLHQRGYRNAHVSIDTSDWYISSRLSKRLRNDPDADLAPYRDYYLNHLWGRAAYYDGLLRQITGRTDIPHVILLHHNLACALFLGNVLEMFKARGWRLLDIETAYSDPLYSIAPNSLPAGQSLAWALAQASGRFEGRLRYPGESDTYEVEAMDAAGL